jgi:hypothetical protein
LFFSNEESRVHVHVFYGEHEAKFWLEPAIELAHNYGLRAKRYKERVSSLRNIAMKSKHAGKNTSEVEVTHISIGGIWLLINDKEFFLPFEKFPWLKEATVAKIHNVEFHKDHLHWPDLDIDLTLESIEHPARFPLVSKISPKATPATGAKPEPNR